ncbi:MAG: hypothetical protein KIT45_05045 [Fimbriimonadia bacterium]|nr:hypothetical protein [Fimbriimonadia bacterium]
MESNRGLLILFGLVVLFAFGSALLSSCNSLGLNGTYEESYMNGAALVLKVRGNQFGFYVQHPNGKETFVLSSRVQRMGDELIEEEVVEKGPGYDLIPDVKFNNVRGRVLDSGRAIQFSGERELLGFVQVYSVTLRKR